MANDAKAPVCTEYSHDMGSSPCLTEASVSQIVYINQPESIESTPLPWAQTRAQAKGDAWLRIVHGTCESPHWMLVGGERAEVQGGQ